jgi:hypothetical protein
MSTSPTSTKFQKPHLSHVEPDSGSPADTIRILGSHLGTAKTVKFKDENQQEKNSTAKVISDDEIETIVPSGLTAGGAQLTVTASGGVSNPLDFTILP